MLPRMRRNENPGALLVGMENGAVWKTVWQSLKKLNMELSYEPAIPLPGEAKGHESNTKGHIL